MRSGVNWIREKLMLAVCATDRAISVFARPGKSSIRTCPSASRPSSTSSSTSRLPTIARSTSSRMRCAASRTSSTRISDSEPLKALDEPVQPNGLHSGFERIRRPLAFRPEQVPAFVPEELADPLGVALEVEAALREQPRSDPAQRRPQPHVELLRAREAEVDRPLEPLELGRTRAASGSYALQLREARPARQGLMGGNGQAAQRGNHHDADDEDGDV